MNYKLIPADRSHLPQLVALERASFHQPWSEQMLAEELYNDMASIIVAEGEDGTFLGYAMVRVVLDEGTLEKIVVAEEYRRFGVAQNLLGAFLSFGKAHLALLTLEVRESNAPAIGLYEKLGFHVVGRRKGYYNTTPKEDAILMTIFFQEEQP